MRKRKMLVEYCPLWSLSYSFKFKLFEGSDSKTKGIPTKSGIENVLTYSRKKENVKQYIDSVSKLFK